MKQIIIEITELGGKPKVRVRDGVVRNRGDVTPIERGAGNYLTNAIQTAIESMENRD